ncbi:MAG: Lrp/AsnC family transcriptional regulator [Nitrosotalea sp.]
MIKLDELDKAIISELSKDASISVPALSRKVKKDSSVLYSRIKRLVKRGFIERYTIVINYRVRLHGQSVVRVKHRSKTS